MEHRSHPHGAVHADLPPDFSMASTALLIRLSSTCCISEGEAWMVGRSGIRFMLMWILLYLARCSQRATLLSTRSFNWTITTLGSVLRAKLSSLWVISLHRFPWVLIGFTPCLHSSIWAPSSNSS